MRIRSNCEEMKLRKPENGVPNLLRLTHVLSGFLNLFQPPTVLQLEPTTRCNLKCRHCFRSSRTSGDMSFGFFKSIVDQLGKPKLLAKKIYLTGLGEPLLNPDVFSMVKYAKERGFEVGFTSNFTLVNEAVASNLIKSGLDRLSISIDGASNHTYEKVRAGSRFDEVVENVRLFVKAKAKSRSRTPKLVFNAVITKLNVDETGEIIRLGETLGVDGVCLSEQITSNRSSEINTRLASLVNEESCRRLLDIELAGFNNSQLPCLATRGCYVTFDGIMLPCSSLAQLVPREEYHKFMLGDLGVESLLSAWYSRGYREFRKRLILGRCRQFCRGCPEGRIRANEYAHFND